ncbi:MAG: dimethyl sulfoxide reductase anchor subunit [Gammaproteobacteria bacterium]|nr:dimethyl sulfoxide reductase anchor subunit [Gammaproteobacteria bacterium]
MFEVRQDEPDYAFIPDASTPKKNKYGKRISLTDDHAELAGQSLNVNGDASIGDNPNRYKQHGFHFTADNCIACHACEAACSEKNQLPAHISFRSVGYLEGGSYPAYKRMNISMACNHCDDPVCLKGCPTRAYTKFAEYGAVLQDPDICFGCGYCTWVCPYNAPQLDPVEGQVSKCNMCVDRLEVGLKPACAAACLGGALDFGIIEAIPENREQAATHIPGFPDTSITNPNIRFQQNKTLPKEMTRPDTAPIRYQQDEQGGGEYKVKPGLRKHKAMQWSLSKLRSREDPLVLFTLISQTVLGAFLILLLGPLFGLEILTQSASPVLVGVTLVCLFLLQCFALFISTMHLGKPHRFYRAFNNLRYSPVSREVASLSVFFGLFAAYIIFINGWIPGLHAGFSSGMGVTFGLFAMIAGLIFIYAMQNIYRIKARPYWDHWQVLTSFYGSVISLGAIAVGLFFAPALFVIGEPVLPLLSILSALIVIGLSIEAMGLYAHAKELNQQGGEGAAAHQVQSSQFGKTYYARNIVFLIAIQMMALLAVVEFSAAINLLLWLLTVVFILAAATVGRALFYVLVIPTTMPGAFFWKNEGFQEHARDSGLAEMQQVGVLAKTDYHHEHLERAKKEIIADWQAIKEQGFLVSLKLFKSEVQQRWQDARGSR